MKTADLFIVGTLGGGYCCIIDWPSGVFACDGWDVEGPVRKTRKAALADARRFAKVNGLKLVEDSK